MVGDERVIVVTGVTGRQGGAVARHLRADGWQVRGVTRSPGSKASRAVARLGVSLVQADVADLAAMTRVCEGAHGVFSVQNPMTSGAEGELVQARNVVDAATAAGISHVVYGSAGPGVPGTGVDAWDGKYSVAEYAREKGVPLTVLRPMAFMELMTDKDLYPPVACWHLMPRLVGPDRPIPWLASDDVGAMAAKAFSDPASYIGTDHALAGDVRTLSECRASWRQAMGRDPRRVPMPVWLFGKVADEDLLRMWRWLASHDVEADVAATRQHLPEAVTVEQFIQRRTRAKG
jgi:uncharacterized protein YbjT (DUF2867 family)